jgi:hypothetical protein
MNRKMKRARKAALRRHRLPENAPVAFDYKGPNDSVDNSFVREAGKR